MCNTGKVKEQEIISLIELKLFFPSATRMFHCVLSQVSLCNQRNANFMFNGSLWIMKESQTHTHKKWAQRDNEQDSSIENERKKTRILCLFFGRLIKIHRYPNLSPL